MGAFRRVCPHGLVVSRTVEERGVEVDREPEAVGGRARTGS